jgi:carbonic anhydrase
MSNNSDERLDYSRRRFLHSMIAGAAIGRARPLSAWLTPPRVALGTRLPPDEAIKELVAGNQRFAANHLTSCGHDLAALREHTVEKQEPFAAVLACADSRVPVELVFDQSIGRLFVTRVAGNVASPEMIASLEYGVAVLGVSAIVVLGHRNCGAVKAALKGESAPGQISSPFAYLRPAVEPGAGNLNTAIDANARVRPTCCGRRHRDTRTAGRGPSRCDRRRTHFSSGKVTLSREVGLTWIGCGLAPTRQRARQCTDDTGGNGDSTHADLWLISLHGRSVSGATNAGMSPRSIAPVRIHGQRRGRYGRWFGDIIYITRRWQKTSSRSAATPAHPRERFRSSNRSAAIRSGIQSGRRFSRRIPGDENHARRDHSG